MRLGFATLIVDKVSGLVWSACDSQGGLVLSGAALGRRIF